MRASLRPQIYPRTKKPDKQTSCVSKIGIKLMIIPFVVLVVLAIGVNAQSIWTVYEYRTTGHAFTTDEAQARLLKLFNEDRNTYAVNPVLLDHESSNRSYYRAMDVRDYQMGEDKSYTRESIFVVSQSEFGRSYYHSPEAIVDTWRNTNPRFRLNELNRDYTTVGIGVAEGNGNFYIVIRWE
jgi:uncharacterized protein YkwD